MGFKASTARSNGKSRSNGFSTAAHTATVAEAATEAVEGAVCYLQEQLAKTGIQLNDHQAFVEICKASTQDNFFWS
jgi:hypothetical protein